MTKLTIKQLKEQLDHFGIEYKSSAKKADLEKLLQNKVDERVEELVKEEEVKAEEKKLEVKNEKKIVVILPNKKRREYSLSTHGKLWKIMAKNYAENPKHKGCKISQA